MSDEDETRAPTDDEIKLSEFTRKLAEKYGAAFDEPIPERLADLILRLEEIKSK